MYKSVYMCLASFYINFILQLNTCGLLYTCCKEILKPISQ